MIGRRQAQFVVVIRPGPAALDRLFDACSSGVGLVHFWPDHRASR
jgi:hypothetical protein